MKTAKEENEHSGEQRGFPLMQSCEWNLYYVAKSIVYKRNTENDD